MKRIVLIVLVAILLAGLTYARGFAKQENLPLTATASSICYSTEHYGPDKAIDEDSQTFWAGNLGDGSWWIKFKAEEVVQIDLIKIEWYGQDYAPLDYDIQISPDDQNWDLVSEGLSAICASEPETIALGRKTRFIRLDINSVPALSQGAGLPILREFQALAKTVVPHQIRFQARLTDAEGLPLDGEFSLTFRLYDAETDGTLLWQENQEAIQIETGLLDAELGSVTEINLSFDRQYWLSVEVNSDGEMTPRFKLTSVPYAFIAEE